MAEELKRALREVRDTLLSNPVSPRVEEPADINLHFCRYVAETVAERSGYEYGIEILEDGGRGFAHTWIAYDGRHYDAECIDGVRDYRDLPFFERHPEAAILVERGAVDRASLRKRGIGPLYPETPAFETRTGPSRVVTGTDRRYAIGAMLVGLALLGFGIGGQWAVHRHLLVQVGTLQTLFVDLKIVGELVVVVSPVVFLVLRPAQRASSR